MAGASPGIEAAVRRLCVDVATIEIMTQRSTSFRDLCDDLAAAEYGLRAAEALPPHVRDQRREEWLEWIETLTKEIREALRDANVVWIRPLRPKG
jgi:hypothetical protein